MRVLLTVVVGYINFDKATLHTKTFTEVLTKEGGAITMAKAIAARIEEIRKSWPSENGGSRSIISVSHPIL